MYYYKAYYDNGMFDIVKSNKPITEKTLISVSRLPATLYNISCIKYLFLLGGGKYNLKHNIKFVK